jgi:hypothetical protein
MYDEKGSHEPDSHALRHNIALIVLGDNNLVHSAWTSVSGPNQAEIEGV